MSPILFETTNWNAIPETQKRGEKGMALYRTVQYETFRVRLVEYSAGYVADHWCSAGHIVYCIEGEMNCELADGSTFILSKGMTYTVSDNVSSHRSATTHGVKLMIIDGSFLNYKRETFFNPWKI